MNNMILKIIVISIFFTPWLSHTRMMSPGVAQTELNRMIRDAKKSPPSPEKTKQLLNDISPSLREYFEDTISAINSKSSSIEEKSEKINNLDIAIALVLEFSNGESASKEGCQNFINDLKKELRLTNKDVEILEKLKDDIFDKKENKDDFDVINMFKENNNDKELTKKNNSQRKEDLVIKLQEFIKSLGDYFEETFGKELTLDKSKIVILNEQQKLLKSTDKAFDVVTKNINTFIEKLYNYQSQYSGNLVGVQNGFTKFFEAFNSLYGMTDSIGKSVTCDVLDVLRYISTKANSILNSTINFGIFGNSGMLKDKKEGNWSLSGSEEYTKFINQMNFIQQKASSNQCKL